MADSSFEEINDKILTVHTVVSIDIELEIIFDAGNISVDIIEIIDVSDSTYCVYCSYD